MKLRLAHSPDADDAFMLFGIRTGAVRADDVELQVETSDIETLNQRAIAGELDVTAVSFAAWPRIAEAYDLLPVGSSFGLGYGPKLVSRRPATLADVAGRVVAVPGELTSAALLLSLSAGTAAQREVPFDRIPDAVASGEFEAGVVIHEGQLTFQRHGLHLVTDLGAWWQEREGLPLPLGATVIRRGLPPRVVAATRRALAESIEYALENRAAALEHALGFARGLDVETADRFVSLYVNDLSLEAGELGRSAVEVFHRRGHEAGLLPRVEARWAG